MLERNHIDIICITLKRYCDITGRMICTFLSESISLESVSLSSVFSAKSLLWACTQTKAEFGAEPAWAFKISIPGAVSQLELLNDNLQVDGSSWGDKERFGGWVGVGFFCWVGICFLQEGVWDVERTWERCSDQLQRVQQVVWNWWSWGRVCGKEK